MTDVATGRIAMHGDEYEEPPDVLNPDRHGRLLKDIYTLHLYSLSCMRPQGVQGRWPF